MSKKTMVVWGVLIVLLVLLIYIIGITYKDELKYIDLKNELKDKTKEYIKKHDVGFPFKITSEELEEKGYIGALELDNKICAADITVKKKFVFYDYDIDFTCIKKS